MLTHQPVALSIAGSDNSCGAGAQADLKSFSASAVYGLTAITCVVAEVPGVVSRIDPISPETVAEQIRLSFSAFPVAAVKTGMLLSSAIIDAVASTLEHALALRPIPVVIDPVMIATSGTPLLNPDAVQTYRDRLFPLATLITPNADELAALTGETIGDHNSLMKAATTLARETQCAILSKGGHLGGELATDHLVLPNGTIQSHSTPFTKGISTHGTGCSFAALIAARLAHGFSLADAFISAKKHLAAAIEQHLRWTTPSTTDALHHFAPIHIPYPAP
jgi:hydroxymethylpyrimidine/phosphomethylpyrimidine kinase